MERLTSYKNECKREMICNHEECFVDEEHCPHVNEDICPCLQEVLEKLAEYEDLEEHGKLLKLPCAVGDMLFVLTEDSPTGIEETRCKSIVFNSKNNFIVYAPCQYDDWGQAKWRFKKSHFGKTVFLSKESAEAALKETSE